MSKTKRERISCDSCQMLSINGVACHETGCPNAKKTWITGRGWVRFIACHECGCDVEAGEACDCQEQAPCRVCGGATDPGGDGYDGLCPTCADKANDIAEETDIDWDAAVEQLEETSDDIC